MKTYERIRELRENHHWTQEDVAKKIDLTPQGYAKIERGETRLTLERLEQFADIFDVDIAQLLSNTSQFFYQNNKDSQHIYQNTQVDDNLKLYQYEIEKLKLSLAYKDEIIARLNEQIVDLRNLNRALIKTNQ
ncbi:hypothetical protein MOMA_07326 [Moraxella macacae 0408225]|uniref:HTH cro/C1-type domain-containing protein n=1 Tax=Moraxella macacae 0408225 TaxID=1230338 RepID=L2F7B6_9GAMM|nr:helix-turn-helix transcriptional regulator [Moraxella macacae]ELA08353.1 hypothetical protein MOMA_07326 [Moraxella macacae 0408225]